MEKCGEELDYNSNRRLEILRYIAKQQHLISHLFCEGTSYYWFIVHSHFLVVIARVKRFLSPGNSKF